MQGSRCRKAYVVQREPTLPLIFLLMSVILSVIVWGCAAPPRSPAPALSSPGPAGGIAPPPLPPTGPAATGSLAPPPAPAMDQPAAGGTPAPSAEEFPPIVIGIMPFTNISGQKDYDWLCTGIAESISTRLGSLPYFSLVERLKLSDAMKEIELGQTGLIADSKAAQTGQMAGAEELVVGSFQIIGQSIRINARFLKVEEGKVRTTAEATGSMDQIFDLQDKIVASFLANLNLPLNDQEKALLAAKLTTSPEAFKQYSQAMDTYTPEGRALSDEQRIAMLDQSTRIDPNFAPAYVQLGDIYAQRRQDYDRAVFYYDRAVVLAPLVIVPRVRLVQVYQIQGNTFALQQQQRQIEELRRANLQQIEKQRFWEERRRKAIFRPGEPPRAQELQRQRILLEQQKAQELQRQRALQEQQKIQELQRQRALQEQQRRQEFRRQQVLQERQKVQEFQRQRALQEQQRGQEFRRQPIPQERQRAQEMQRVKVPPKPQSQPKKAKEEKKKAQ